MTHLLLCYDGSTAADAAIERAATLHPGARATVLTAWKAMDSYVLTRIAFPGNDSEIDERIEFAAKNIAEKGTAHAEAAGLDATAATARSGPSVGREIVTWAERERPDVVVVGATGQSAIADVLTGSVAGFVVHHSPVPVLLIRT